MTKSRTASPGTGTAAAGRDSAHAGARVVGYVGSTVPVELIEAYGLTPIAVSPEGAPPTGPATELFEEEFPLEQRLIADAVARELWSFAECLVIDHSHSDLFYNLRELRRQHVTGGLPPVIAFDLIATAQPSLDEYNRTEVARLSEALAPLGTGDLTSKGLQAATERWNRARSAVEQLGAARRERRLTGSQLFSALLQWRIGPAARVNDALRLTLEETNAVPPGSADGVPIIVVASDRLHTARLHETLELAGGFVAGEDDPLAPQALGAGQLGDPASFSAPADRYARYGATRTMHPFGQRNAWLLDIAPREARGVVFVVAGHDRRLGWDIPRLRAELATKQVRSTVISVESCDSALQPAQIDTLQAELDQWR
jgi:2-hydroxyglutaryl-CoA dehydratase, D-component